ncbi:MAG: hypothetical protein LBT59_29110 [Clostridiales bacterium]|nr:hypothetical protein [Clostridiales bacterium]
MKYRKAIAMIARGLSDMHDLAIKGFMAQAPWTPGEDFPVLIKFWLCAYTCRKFFCKGLLGFEIQKSFAPALCAFLCLGLDAPCHQGCGLYSRGLAVPDDKKHCQKEG